MSHQTIFRSAFIVESVQVRIAAKSQKKFAIVTISDGIEQQELPIWADLYEEKNHLLQENQLLYAVLQLDKRNEEVRLSCRWLDDLTKADEIMIEACDRAYDKAKHYVQRIAQVKPTIAKTSTQQTAHLTMKKETLMIKPLLIRLDADQTNLSHILQLKHIFSQHIGTLPIQIHFQTSTRSLGILHLEGQGGVAVTDSFKQKLYEIKCVLAIE